MIRYQHPGIGGGTGFVQDSTESIEETLPVSAFPEDPVSFDASDDEDHDVLQ
jgi:hypothetical protein